MADIQIDGQNFPPGQNGKVSIDIADLPSGTKIFLPIHVFRGQNPGPTLLISGGLHGDEINSVEIVRRCLVRGLFENLNAGTVIAIPIINIYGFINFSREVPDGKDVNRSFPGSARGSLASQVAHVLSTEILPTIDFGIDFHTGGATRYNFPQIRFSKTDPKAEELARAFAAPITIGNDVIDKSFRKEALNQGKSIIVFEGAESKRYDELSTEEGYKGIQRILHYLDMYSAEDMIEGSVQTVYTETHWQRAEKAGLYIFAKSSGEEVKEGDYMGTIHDPHNTYEHLVKADRTGIVIGHNNSPIVNAGDALFHYAW